MKARPSCLALCAMVVAAAGCGGDVGADAPPVAVTDSAGVRVVVHDASEPFSNGWTAAAEPEVRIGAVDDPEQQLSGVRGAHALEDGTIVVADRGSSTLRFFGTDGALLATAGGEGEGPGEFLSITDMAVSPADSLYVYDIRLRRVSVFGPDGTYTRSFRLAVDGERGTGTFQGLFDDGSVLVQGFANAGGGEMPEGSHVSGSALYRYSGTGEFLDSLPVVRRNDGYYEPIEFPGGMGFWFTTPLFAHGTHPVAGEGLWVADSRGPRLERRTPEGGLEMVVRIEGLDRALTDERLALQKRVLLEREEDEDERVRTEQAFDAMTLPESMPGLSDLAVDDAGRAWVRAYDPALGDAAPWTVYGTDGVPLATVTLPAGLNPLHIGEDHLLGIRRDELDVEYVEMYRLEKGADGGA